MKRTTVVMVLVAAIVGLERAVPAPVPSEVPLEWELEFEYDKPHPIRVRLPGDAQDTTFWYMQYTVTNRTGRDRVYMPQFTLYTDTGKLVAADKGIPGTVFRAIKTRHNNPLLTDMTGMTGKLVQGSDNAKDGVAIWPDIDPKAGQIDVFVGGLSGESATITLPKPITVTEMDSQGKRQTVRREQITLHKTLRLRYRLPGAAAGRTYEKVTFVEREWVMR